EQTAQLLARRDGAARRRASATPSPAHDTGPRSGGPASWRAAAQLRSEVNRLVRVLAARTGGSHAQLHAQLRRAVPGPASAAADASVLEQRRDHLMALLGG
ncbi:MAG TPA: hypothetical protein VFU35_04600, partial [Jatrophihabitans sp.]|nr:hypothetical protein [Jatrophihabitans sp.]